MTTKTCDIALALVVLGCIGSGHRAVNSAEREAFRRGIRVMREELEHAVQALAAMALEQLKTSGGNHGNRNQAG